MNIEEYEKLFKLEKDYWWYVGLRKCVLDTVKKYIGNSRQTLILDAGCGAGFLLLKLKKIGTPFGMDISAEAIDFCRSRELERLIQGSVSWIPFRENTFDIIISLDVLYHKGVDDDRIVLREFYRALRPEGLLIVNVPAFEFMRSQHDLAVHTKRRYTKRTLRQKIEGSNFGVEKITYRNIFLFPLIMIFRICKNFSLNLNCRESDLKRLPSWLNTFLIGLLCIENFFINRLYVPFGLSVYCIARKK